MTKFLIVRNRKTGEPVMIHETAIPKEIRPSKWFENGYWRYRPDKKVLEPIISRYLKARALASYEARAVAQYIVDYACHIAVAAYIFGGGDETLEFNTECISKLRALARGASSREDIGEMIRVGMDYALDPL